MTFIIPVIIVAVVVFVVALVCWFCWDEGIGVPGYLKREIRYEQARRRADQIAWDARQRINRL